MGVRLFAGTPWDRPPTCERCGKLEQELPVSCRRSLCSRRIWPPRSRPRRLAIEKRPGRRFVTAVRGLAAADNDLPSLLARLKAACGAGGTLKDDVIEIQGRQLDRVRSLLQELGYKVSG